MLKNQIKIKYVHWDLCNSFQIWLFHTWNYHSSTNKMKGFRILGLEIDLITSKKLERKY